MDPTIHDFERRERRSRWFPALVVILIIGLIASTWVGLFGFLGSNQLAGAVDAFEERYIPDIGPGDIDTFANLSQLSELYSSDGVKLAELSDRLSDPVPLSEIPRNVVDAILAAEDGDFYTHNGVDFKGVMRAAVSNFSGGNIQGASTITQQVVRGQGYVGTEQTVLRKIAEMRYAVELEARYTKDQILEFYLNSVYFGWNAYGIKAAAREYFGKTLDELTTAEAAALATTIRNPSLYNPRKRPELVVDRRNSVLDQMAAKNFITPAQAALEKEQPLDVIPHQKFLEPAPQVRILAVRQLLNDPEFAVLGATPEQRQIAIFGCAADDIGCEERPGLKGGLKITTTVDFQYQELANGILRQWLPVPEDGSKAPTGAITTVDNRTGAIEVMASGLDFGTDFAAGQRDYDIATEGQRQPGSSFKPFALVAYLEKGGSMNSYWNAGSPIEIDCDVPCGPNGEYVWKVGNASGSSESRLLRLFDATVNSVNTVYAQVAVEDGPAAIKETAQRMGVKSDLPEVFSLALGAGEVSPLDMASAYSTLANYGIHREPYLIQRIEDAEGNLLYEHQTQEEQVLDPALAAVVVEAMRSVVSGGTATRANMPDRQEAGKTGTTQSYRDAWFVGFVPQYSTAVWVGYADEQIALRNITINGEYYSRVFGGSVPAPIWKQFMTEFLADVPSVDFPPLPDGASKYKITPSTKVPDVIGQQETEAKDKVYTAHLNVEVVEVNSLDPVGVVVTQTPEAGASMPHGGTVTLEVSNGLPPTIVLPNLVGLTLTEATSRLAALAGESGILVAPTPVFAEVEDSSLWNRIIRTEPPAGATVGSTETVTVVIGRPPS